jgi:protein-disulfide isomerase
MSRLSRMIALAAALLALGAASAGTAAGPLPGDMSLGNPKAAIQVVEYASLSCSHCAHFNAQVFRAFKAKYLDTGRAYFTMREFLTPPANVAAAGWVLARCAGPGKYFSVVDAVFDSQVELSGGDPRGSLLKVARANGMTAAKFDTCMKNEAAFDALNARVRRAADVEGVDSTPTLEVNGRRLDYPPSSLAEFETMIDRAQKKPGGH